jgi:hypothetical protein
MPFVKKPGYKKFNVKEDSPYWFGWNFFENLLKICETDPEIKKIVSFVPSSIPELQALLAICIRTGLRIEEILKYFWSKEKNDYIYGIRGEQVREDLRPDALILLHTNVLKQFRSVKQDGTTKPIPVQKWKCLGHCKNRWDVEPSPELKAKHENKIVPYTGYKTDRTVVFKDVVINRQIVKDGVLVPDPFVEYILNWKRIRPTGLLFEKWDYNHFYRVTKVLSQRTGKKICPHLFRSQLCHYLGTELGLSAAEIA